jgi:hypothetical protein
MPVDVVSEPVAWRRTGDGEFPYAASCDGVELRLRVNDFPAEPLYTLLVNGQPALDLEDWPAPWLRPAATPEQLRIAGAAQLRRGRFDAIVVADWAYRLCVAPAGPAEVVLEALGPAADRPSLDRVLDAPPPGIDRLAVVEQDNIVTAIRVEPTGGLPNRTDLAAVLGLAAESDGAALARFHVAAAGASFSCEVVADYGPRRPAELLFQRQPPPGP